MVRSNMVLLIMAGLSDGEASVLGEGFVHSLPFTVWLESLSFNPKGQGFSESKEKKILLFFLRLPVGPFTRVSV